MKPREFVKGIYTIGVVDWDRRLFDSLIPLPDGTSYNAYLIKGSEKTALIDTVDRLTPDTLIDNLDLLGVKQLDYIISNHAEPDHSGAIPRVAARYPEAKVVCTPRAKDMLIDLFHLPAEKFQTVNDLETISLGDRTLEFIH
ncbi:MAG: MBL fold metallo-hydrolase, partial [Dehalococcoidales bacterium]|nr:MBL fold metallo-hydrolase [Dehalococcoidales bacterium]